MPIPRRSRQSPLPLWIGLAVLAAFGALGLGDPATATAETPQIAHAALGSTWASGLLGFGPRALMLLGLTGLLIFPDRIAPGSRVRRDPSAR